MNRLDVESLGKKVHQYEHDKRSIFVKTYLLLTAHPKDVHELEMDMVRDMAGLDMKDRPLSMKKFHLYGAEINAVRSSDVKVGEWMLTLGIEYPEY